MKNETKCKRCSACCVAMGSPGPLGHIRAGRHLPKGARAVSKWFFEVDPDRDEHLTPCYFLNLRTRRCLIHDHKPPWCADFEPGGPFCETARIGLLPVLDQFNRALLEAEGISDPDDGGNGLIRLPDDPAPPKPGSIDEL